MLQRFIVKLFLLVSIFSFSQENFNQNNEPILILSDTIVVRKPLTPLEKTDSIITAYKNDPVLRNAQWGFCVYNPKTKKIVVAKDEQQAYIPASTTKLITTEAALSLIGENFKWKTELDYSGEIDSLGTLNGNLYLVGNNDPTLGYTRLGALSKQDFFNELYDKLVEKGIQKVNGNIISEAAIFKTDFHTLPTDLVKFDLGNYYSVPNSIVIEEDALAQYNPTNQEEGDENSSLFTQTSYDITKEMNKKKVIENTSVVLPPAPTFLAKEFKNYLLKNKKYKITGTVANQNYSTIQTAVLRKKIHVVESPALKEVVHFVNQTSSNHFAEKLLTSVGYFIGKKPTKETGIDHVLTHLNKNKFDTAGLTYADGSGLSRANHVTPIAQVKYLAEIMKKPYFNIFYDSLPKAGETGTLKKMFINSSAIGKLRAKTGTLSNVKALTGYVDTKSGERLCFSLLVNNFSNMQLAKQRMQALMESIVEY